MTLRNAQLVMRAAGVGVALALAAVGLTGCEPMPTELTITLTGGRSAPFDGAVYTVRCGPETAQISPEVPGLNAETACAVADRSYELLKPRNETDLRNHRFCPWVEGRPERAIIEGSVGDQVADRSLSSSNVCSMGDWGKLRGLLPMP